MLASEFIRESGRSRIYMIGEGMRRLEVYEGKV